MTLNAMECRHAATTVDQKKLHDERGLYLLVKPKGKYWRMDYRHQGLRKTLALGVYHHETGVSLAEARKRRDEAREILERGDDPGLVKAARKHALSEAAASSFKSVALEWHRHNASPLPGLQGRVPRDPIWSPKTASKHLAYLNNDLFPYLAAQQLSSVTAPELRAVFERVQARGAAYTAKRLREVCSQIFRFAMAKGLTKENPAHALMRSIDAPRTIHRPALTDPRAFGAFTRDLANFKGADALTHLALRLAMLTLLRSAELRGGKWSEVDFEGREWRIPPSRMKSHKDSRQAHVVPLSDEAITALRELKVLTGHGTQMFPKTYGDRDGIMSDNTLGRALIRMGYQGKQTVHGLRASARSILSERGWNVAALERQLDHVELNPVVRAYARSDHLSERRKFMDDWGSLVKSLEDGGAKLHREPNTL